MTNDDRKRSSDYLCSHSEEVKSTELFLQLVIGEIRKSFDRLLRDADIDLCT